MISNQILQTTLDGLKGITRIEFCITDTDGKVLATTFQGAEAYEGAAFAFTESPADSQVVNGCQFFKIFDEGQLEFVLLAQGASEDVYMVGKLAAFQVQNLLTAYKERFDKDNFVKNLLLDNLLLVDIYNRAKKLHIETDVRRVVFIIETKNDRDVNVLETVRGFFTGKSRDFVTAVDGRNIIFVRELRDGEGYEDLDRTAAEILNIPREAVKEGLEKARWPARFELVSEDPPFIVDGGHNPQCAESVRDNLLRYFPDRRRVLLVGVLGDKDYPALFEILNQAADEWVCVTPNSERALPAGDLAAFLERYGKPVTVCASIPEGVDAAREKAGEDGMACAVGSLYMAGAVRACFGLC